MPAQLCQGLRCLRLDLSSSFLSCGACNLMKKYSVRTGMYSSLTPEKPVILAPSFCLAKASR